MDGGLAALLDRIHRHGVEHDAATPDRRDRFRNLEPASGALLNVLVRAMGARTALELGTSNGYSTLCIADALRATGGRLLTVDIDAGRSAKATAHLREAGLENLVDARIADAGATLQQQPDASLDFVFLDAERDQYVAYWSQLRRALRPGGLLAVDNVLSHAADVREFCAVVSASPDITDTVVPTGAGLLLVVIG